MYDGVYGNLLEKWGILYNSLRWLLRSKLPSKEEKQFYIKNFIDATNTIVRLYQH